MKIKSLIVILLFLGIWVNAQNDMLIGQLADKIVTRKNYDENKGLISKQTFKVGKIKEANAYYEIDVITELFDKNEKSTDKYSTIYRCKPDEYSVMLMAFPFSNSKSKEIKITATSKNFKHLYNLDNLEDVEMEIIFDSGLLSFFASKSSIKIYDRILDSVEDKKIIISKLNVKAYALGIKIKSFEYTVTEKLNNKKLLFFQEFKEKDGSYFTLTYNKS